MNTSPTTTGRRLVRAESAADYGSGGVLAAIVRTVARWQSRAAQRSHLAALEPHMRRDIGLSDAEIEHEVRKPFWIA